MWRPRPQWVGTDVPKKFWTSFVRPHSVRNDNKILYGDQTTREENFYMVDRGCWCVICLWYITFFTFVLWLVFIKILLFMIFHCNRPFSRRHVTFLSLQTLAVGCQSNIINMQKSLAVTLPWKFLHVYTLNTTLLTVRHYTVSDLSYCYQ